MKSESFDIKIGSKEEAAWRGIAKRTEEDIINSRIGLEISEEILKFAKKREIEEREKFQKL